jgi:hypothetical protein
MADDEFDGRPYRDTLTVPGIMVMPDDPWPAEFYSRYPNAMRVPVRIVWREGSSARDGGTTTRLSPPAATAQLGASAGAPAEESPARAPSRGISATADNARSGRETPIGTFLRVNDFLDLLMGSPQPESESHTR